MPKLSEFLKAESGAITVDWVVITAATVGLGLASVTAVQTGTGNLGEGIRAALSNAQVAGILPRTVVAFSFDDVTGLQRTGWGWVAYGSYQGWTAIGPTQAIEIVESGHRGVHSPDGGNWIDLDASPGNLTLARALEGLTPGQTYSLRFNAATSHANNGVDIYIAGEFVRHIAPESIEFDGFDIPFTAGGGDGSNQIEFRGTGVPNGFGVSLHGIRIDQ